MLTMNSHGVEISIAGCVEEMVRVILLTTLHLRAALYRRLSPQP